MKIGNLEIKLYYSNLAARELSELCGGLNKIGTLLRGEDEEHPISVIEQQANIAKLIRILANAEITKHNCEIALGIQDGEKKEKWKDEDLEMLLDASKLDEYLYEIFETMGLASKFVIPDSVKLSEPDIDLEEIEKEKNP